MIVTSGITGSIAATNGVISGSSQITGLGFYDSFNENENYEENVYNGISYEEFKKTLEWYRNILEPLYCYKYLSEKNIIGTSVYSSTKSFLDKFVKNISLENIKYHITANTIQLGYFDGGMTYKIPETIINEIKKDIGLNRFGSIEELFNTIQFIISNEYVTGINLKIDGGLK